MADKSNIEWTDASWSPVTGCTRVSSGCDHCYSATLSKRLAAMGQAKYQGIVGNGHFNGVVKLHEAELEKPLRWRKPRRIFVNSMSDTFHKSVPFEFIDKLFAVMALCPQHTFQVLTKRPERMAEYFADDEWGWRVMEAANTFADHPAFGAGWRAWNNGGEHLPMVPLPNVWLGTSVENQATADERIPHLLRCPAAVRFLSCEPLLGPVDLTRWLDPTHTDSCGECNYPGERFVDVEKFETTNRGDLICPWCGGGHTEFYGDDCELGWVIVGGESGPGARPMHPDWARSLRDQCQAAGVPFFFKQWGEWTSIHNCAHIAQKIDEGRYDVGEWHADNTFDQGCICGSGHGTVVRVGKKAAGRLLDGREWSEFPTPELTTASAKRS